MKGSAEERHLEHQVFTSGDAGRSDHVCFAEQGVPAVLASAMCINIDQCYCCYHTPEDTIDTISKPSLQASVELLWAFLEPVARGEEARYLE